MRAWTQLFERGPALATLCIFLVFATQTYAGKYFFLNIFFIHLNFLVSNMSKRKAHSNTTKADIVDI